MHTRSRLVPLVIALGLALAAPAAAQFGGVKIGGKKVSLGDSAKKLTEKKDKEQRKALGEVNSRSQKGARKVPGNWRSGAEKKAADFAEALKIHEELTALIKQHDLKSHKSWGNVQRYWDSFDSQVQMGKLQLPVLQAYEPVADAHKRGKVVDQAALDALKAASDAFTAGANDDAKRSAEFFAKFAAEAPAKNAELEKAGALKAAKAASAAEAKAQNEQLDKLDAHLEAWRALTKKGEAAVPDADLADFEAVLAEVVKFKASAPAWYGDQLMYHRGYNQWLAGDWAGLAATVGATVVTTGETTGKKAKISFAAEADTCYAVVRKWKQHTNAVRSDLDFSYDKGTHAHYIQVNGTALPTLRGFCATGPLKATYAGKLEFPGSKNGLDYAVFSWKRDAYPMALAVATDYGKPDPCSPAHVYQVWTRPAPGAMVYKGEAPYLRDGDDDTWVTTGSITHGNGRSQWSELSSTAPEARAFGQAFRLGSCWGEDSSLNKNARKLAKCKTTLRAKYGPKFAKANKKKDKAKYVHEVKEANKTLERLEKQESKEYAKKCQPTRDRIEKAMKANFDKLADWYADNAPPNELDVRRHIQLRRDAMYDRPGRR